MPPSAREMPSTIVSIIQPMAAFWRSTSNASSAVPRITTSHTTRHSLMPSERAWSKRSFGRLRITAAIDVTKKTVMPKTSSASLSVCPPPRVMVKMSVSPISPRKRPLLTAAAIGRKNGMTVRYDSASEISSVQAIAWTLSMRLVMSSRPSPRIQSVPSAAKTSSGRGRTEIGIVHHATRATTAWPAIRILMTAGETGRLGRTTSRGWGIGWCWVSLRTAHQNDFDAAILRLSFRRRIGRDRIRRAVCEDRHALRGEVHARLLHQPLFDRERALLGELLIRIGAADVVGVAVDLDRRAAGDEQLTLQLFQHLLAFGRERRAAGVEGDVPRAAADDVLRRFR